jgi:hypothetical protein
MCCTLQRMPGFGEYQPNPRRDGAPSNFSNLHQDRSTSDRPAQPSWQLAKEDIEMAEHLIDYSQGQRENNSHMNNGQREGDSPSSSQYDLQGANTPSGSGTSIERTRQLTPRSELRERNDSGDNYESQIIPSSEVVTSGQVCRWA